MKLGVVGHLPEGRVKRSEHLQAALPSQTTQPQQLPPRDCKVRPPPHLQHQRPVERSRALLIISDLAHEVASLKAAIETKLRPQQEPKIPNYFAYRRDEISAQGPAYRGTAMLILGYVMHEVERLTSFEIMCSIGHPLRFQRSNSHAHNRRPQRQTQDMGLTLRLQAGRLVMEVAERLEYEMLGLDAPTHVPTDMRHRLGVPDIMLGHKIRKPMHGRLCTAWSRSICLSS
ncbi:hypothetical protein EVAR_35681_1 [Eumeta japonica]|uniref:Uncharacterized protein n=1 Tax=Eumeta variegata TaxID=151549 RepID=A0A4C1VDP4_EUMVA|nr:hypothetical protein EVAR_35681_1 [Eumeta japonica]